MSSHDLTSIAGLLFALLAFASRPAVAAEQPTPKHPVLDHGIDPAKAADYEKAVERVMAMPEDEMLSFIPDKPFTAYCECPKCYGGVEGNHIFTWTIDRPNEMKCKFCETVFPNDEYPEDKVLGGQNKLGETITFPYHLNEETSISHFLTGNLGRWRRQWLMNQCVALGKAYHATGNEEYARKAILIFDRIAQVYPHYPIMQNLPRRFLFRESQDFPFPWDSGRWGYFHNEIPKYAIRAYDLVYDSQEFDELSKDRGHDVRQRFEDDFLRVTFRAAEVQTHHLSNVIGYDVAGAALLGRVVGEPRYVHWAFGWMKKTLLSGFFFDGMWKEAPSYHYMTIGGLKGAFSSVRGHTDPPGYVDEIDETRFDDLQPEVQFPFWARVQTAPSALDLPNGCSTCVHDTHPYEKRSKPRDKTVSTICPGFGHASLGRGSGPNQMQAQLHFSGSYGHAHLDNLNLTLFAKERELLPDLGYTWTQMRYWTTCSLGHNLVVVDRKDQDGRPSDGDLLTYFPDSAGVSVVEADGKRAYSNIEGLDMYRRLLVVIPVSDADAYVVDIFRVRGGKMHDWTLHGDADHDTVTSCSLGLTGKRNTMLEPGEEWVEPTIEGARFNPYGMVRDVRTAKSDGSFTVDFAYPGEPTRGLRTHVLPNGPSEVSFGKSPSVRRMGQGSRGDMRKAYDFWMPHLIVRRQGDAALASVFAAVHEPHSGRPLLANVERLQVDPAEPSAVALRLAHGDTVDTVISTVDEPPYGACSASGVTLRGRLGIVRRTAGEVTAMWMFDAGELACGRSRLTAEGGRYAGTVSATMREAEGAEHDAFTTDADLPAGNALRGLWMIVTHGNGFTHGYEIERVKEQDGKRLVILASDHGLAIDGDETREVFFPQRTIRGPNTFAIPTAVTWAVRGGQPGPR